MKKLIAFMLFMLASTGFAEHFKPSSKETKEVQKEFSMNPETTMVINLPISSKTMQPLYFKLEDLLARNTLPNRMTIILDSPGGEVQSGLKFIELMSAAQMKGTKFDCIVHHMAASMAFQILLQCDKRMTYEGALLLWHGVRVFVDGAVLTSAGTRHLASELEELDAFLLAPLVKGLSKDMDYDTIMYHHNLETFHNGRAFAKKAPNFINSVSYVEGIYATLADPKTTVTTKPKSIFDILFGGKHQQFIYIHEAYQADYIELMKAQ